MNIGQILLSVQKTYRFRIKTIVPLGEDECLRIERALLKFDPLTMTVVRKTIFQARPLDFASVDGGEVYYFDIELGLPASQQVLHRDMVKAIGCAEKFVVVRSETEPGQEAMEADAAEAAIDAEAKAAGLSPAALFGDDSYAEAGHPEHPGLQDSASALLAALAEIAGRRQEAMKVDPKDPLFRWLDQEKPAQDEAAFNADIPGAPKVYGLSKPENTSAPKVEYRKVFRKKNGDEAVIGRTLNGFE